MSWLLAAMIEVDRVSQPDVLKRADTVKPRHQAEIACQSKDKADVPKSLRQRDGRNVIRYEAQPHRIANPGSQTTPNVFTALRPIDTEKNTPLYLGEAARIICELYGDQNSVNHKVRGRHVVRPESDLRPV